MATPETTSWNLIQGAAEGDATSRESFATRYAPPVKDYLAARWRGSPQYRELDDAVQEVFVECFRERGVLDSVDPTRPGGFRAFLYGVVRNVALRHEKRNARRKEEQSSSLYDPEARAASQDTLSRQFDKAWAKNLLHLAVEEMAKAAVDDEDALRRVDLLRLRFQEGIPIRDIAKQGKTDPTLLHRQFTKAKREFKAALTELLMVRQGTSEQDIDREIAALLELLR